MDHATWEGTHYEIGFRWGALLEQRGNYILEHVPFPITEERVRFGAACVPAYQTWFPEILEELQGLADGQHCQVELLQAVLFSMYAIQPACHCSCLAVSNGKEILLGRNSDFLPALEEQDLNVLCHAAGACRFTGNTTAFAEMEDGVNEHGLAVGLTSVYTRRARPGLNAGMLARLFLERCRTVREVLELVRRLPIASAQTFTLADAAGEIAVVECGGEHMEVLRPTEERPYVCAVNTFHTPPLAGTLPAGLDDWEAETRYQTMVRALDRKARTTGLRGIQDILSAREGFLCQYDRSTGRDTVWSVVYDLKNGRVYRAEGNPGREAFRLDRRSQFVRDM